MATTDDDDLTPAARDIRDGYLAAHRAIERSKEWTPEQVEAYEKRVKTTDLTFLVSFLVGGASFFLGIIGWIPVWASVAGVVAAIILAPILATVLLDR